jgi:hypothetical protein
MKNASPSAKHQVRFRPSRLSELNAAVGPSVYAVMVMTDDGPAVKIGYSANITQRLGRLRNPVVLALMPGSLADERDIHRRLDAPRAHGREYYHPGPEVLAEINAMREHLGHWLEPLKLEDLRLV